MECYVELVESCQSIEEEVCYLRQLLAFLDDNINNLKAENALEDLKQEVEENTLRIFTLIRLSICARFREPEKKGKGNTIKEKNCLKI